MDANEAPRVKLTHQIDPKLLKELKSRRKGIDTDFGQALVYQADQALA